MKLTGLIIIILLFSCEKKKNTTQDLNTVNASYIKTIETDSTNLFGEALALNDQDPVSLNDAIDKKIYEKKIRLKGFVTNSCKKKGCWMIIQDGNKTARVTFKDYSFFVPLGFKDKHVVIEGNLKEEMVPESVRKHIAEDEGKSEEEIQKIIGEEKEYSFEASSVLVISK